MKKAMAGALCALLLAGQAEAAVEDHAVSAILVEARTGRVLYEKNPHERRSIASITKLMTALVAVESTPGLDRVVKVEAEWLAGAEGSSIYLAPGEELTLEELLYGLLLESGNDAAQVIAASCAGDMATFVEWMNRRAAELGMADTHFDNPSGLDSETHYSTAWDMALCARACMEDPVVSKIAATKSATLGTRTFTNHNKLLGQYEGCLGMKTGYTDEAGRTLVTCAQRDGLRLIAVTLADPDDWADHAALYDYGFAAWEDRALCRAGKTVRTLPVTGSLVRFVGVAPRSAVTYPLRPEETPTVAVELPESVPAPVEEGSIAGRMDFYLGGEKVDSVYLVYTRSVAENTVPLRPLWQRLRDLPPARAAMGVFWGERQGPGFPAPAPVDTPPPAW